MDYTMHYESPLGGITMASDGEALCGLWFDGQKYFAAGLSQDHEEKELPIFQQTIRWLDVYFSGKEPDFISAERALFGDGVADGVEQFLLR